MDRSASIHLLSFCLILLILPGLGICDIYDQTDALIDSFRAWSMESTSLAKKETANDLIQPDSLGDLFPTATISFDNSHSCYQLNLPPYMGILRSSLLLEATDDPTVPAPSWRVPVETGSSGFLIDSTLIECEEELLNEPGLIKYISDRLTGFRTAGLEAKYRHPLVCPDSLSITVRVSGRYPAEIMFSSDKWRNTIHRLAADRIIYAGLIGIESPSQYKLSLEFYLLITDVGAMGHHYIQWDEILVKRDVQWIPEEINIDLIPYIPTGNIKDLFAIPDETTNEPILIEIE